MLEVVSIGVLVALTGLQAKPDRSQQKKPAPVPTASSARLHFFPGKYAEAKASAKERNVPILIHVVIEGEAQNDEYREKILPERDLVAASASVIVILANNGTHAKKTIEQSVEGQPVKREVCSLYGLDDCSQHKRFWEEIYPDFKQDSGEMYCPQTIVLSPDGKVAKRINTRAVPPVSEIIAAVKEAQQKAGPGLSEAELGEVKRLLGEGQTMTAAKTWSSALRTWQKLLAITPKSTWADQAQKGVGVAEAGLAAELERVSALLVPGRAAQGYKELTDLEKQTAGLSISKEIKARIAKAETTKEIQGEIAAYKLGLEADALMVEAKGLFDAKQDKKAERAVRRLLAKRFAATPAAAKARELWPDWAKDEDAKTNKP